MEVWGASSSGETRQRGERTSEKKKKNPELEDLKQPPGHAGVEEVHLSGVDFLQQEQQQSSTPPTRPLPAVKHIVLNHISPFWPFTPFTPHPSLSRREEHLHM